MISIVMAAYNRADLLDWTLRSIRNQYFPGEIIVVEDGYDNGFTGCICRAHGAKWIQRIDRPNVPFSNQSVPLNMALDAAKGEILIIQNPECLHVGKVIMPLAEAVTENTAVFARCIAQNHDGTLGQDYCSSGNPRPFFFCGAIRADRMLRFDESFKFYGWEDDDMRDQLKDAGMQFVFRDDIVVHHQWHPSLWHGNPEGTAGEWANRELYLRKRLTHIPS